MSYLKFNARGEAIAIVAAFTTGCVELPPEIEESIRANPRSIKMYALNEDLSLGYKIDPVSIGYFLAKLKSSRTLPAAPSYLACVKEQEGKYVTSYSPAHRALSKFSLYVFSEDSRLLTRCLFGETLDIPKEDHFLACWNITPEVLYVR